MRVPKLTTGLVITAIVLTAALPSFAVSKEMIQLQTQVQTLTDQVARLQQTLDERMGVLRNLVEQSADSVNKMSVAVNDLQRKAQADGVDVTDHGAWDAWLGNEAVSCAVRVEKRTFLN